MSRRKAGETSAGGEIGPARKAVRGISVADVYPGLMDFAQEIWSGRREQIRASNPLIKNGFHRFGTLQPASQCTSSSHLATDVCPPQSTYSYWKPWLVHRARWPHLLAALPPCERRRAMNRSKDGDNVSLLGRSR